MQGLNPLLCDASLRQRLAANISRFAVQAEAGAAEGLKRAAVAVTIVNIARDPHVPGLAFQIEHARDAALVLTRRAMHLKAHAGQWAFPGGRLDAGETPEAATLRELEEEVGLKLDPTRIMGRLDDFQTRSGFVITPVVVWGGPDVVMVPNLGEVDSIHNIPFSEILRRDSPVLDAVPGSKNPVLRMLIGRGWIAAPTAAVLYQFREVAIFGRSLRVSHYEQPRFAWK